MAAAKPRDLSGAAVTVLAGGAIANNYAIQPALVRIARSLHTSGEAVGLVLTATMTGYLLGLVFLVPLADRITPRVLIPGQLVGLAGTLSSVYLLLYYAAGEDRTLSPRPKSSP